jgi:hypothetical protein
MEMLKKPLTILNLSGELALELKEYFSLREILIIEPNDLSPEKNFGHILVKDAADFELLNTKYRLKEKKRHIISLTKVHDLQSFTRNTGNLILDRTWFLGPMGPLILDKYFQEYGGISLAENYPAFKELGTFNVTNPFNTGEYLDRLVHNAFENSIDGLTLKSYFDHLIMFITSLKKKGKAGLPFEVTYGAFNGVFAVQVHFFSNKISLKDLTASLSSVITKKTDEYLLNVAIQSADFFDFSYLPEVNKIVITGLWTQDERINFENRGLMFATLTGGIPLVRYQDEGSSSSLVSDSEFLDHTDKILPGTPASDEGSTVVSGQEDTSDEVLVIKGSKDLEELVQTVKFKFDTRDKTVVRLAGDKLNVEEAAFRIAANVDETAKEHNLKIRSLGPQLSAAIKTGLFDFAKKLNKPPQDLSQEDLEEYQNQEIAKLIKEGIQKPNENMLVRSLEGELIAGVKSGQEDLGQLETKLQTANVENARLKRLLKTIASEVRILKDSRNQLAESQTKSNQTLDEIPLQVQDDDETLRSYFQQHLSEKRALNEQDAQKLSELLERESKLISDLKQEEVKTRKIQREAAQKENLFSQELEKSEKQVKAKDLILMKTRENFNKLLDKKEYEIKELKTKADQLSSALALSPSATQTVLVKELEKDNQNLSKQLEFYKTKVTSLASNMQTAKPDDSLKEEARKLQMTNQQLKNQLDATKKEAEKWQNKSAKESSELVALRQDKINLEQLVKKTTLESMKEAESPKTQLNDQELKRLQAHNQILETQLRDSAQKMTALEAKLAEALKPQRTVANGDDGNKVKLNQLENSVKKLTQDVIENRSQLVEAKKETNKLRQEKTALQNQLDRLKKEAEKAKSASPKKSDGKAA